MILECQPPGPLGLDLTRVFIYLGSSGFGLGLGGLGTKILGPVLDNKTAGQDVSQKTYVLLTSTRGRKFFI